MVDGVLDLHHHRNNHNHQVTIIEPGWFGKLKYRYIFPKFSEKIVFWIKMSSSSMESNIGLLLVFWPIHPPPPPPNANFLTL